MKRSLVPLAVILVAAGFVLNHCKCEAQKAMKAVDNFMGFSRGEDMTKSAEEPRPGYALRTRSQEVVAGRSRVTAEVEVGPDLDASSLEKVLRDACHDQKLDRGASVIKVIAWPGKLKNLARPLGECVFARDGHGWEGTGVGFEKVRVNLPSAEEMEARGLSPLSEQEYLRILGVENLMNRGLSKEDAIRKTAAHHEVPAQQVVQAIEKLGKLLGNPD